MLASKYVLALIRGLVMGKIKNLDFPIFLMNLDQLSVSSK